MKILKEKRTSGKLSDKLCLNLNHFDGAVSRIKLRSYYLKEEINFSNIKEDKIVNIFNNEITLTNDERIFINIYLKFLKGLKDLMSDIEMYDHHPSSTKILGLNEVTNRSIGFLVEMIRFFLEYTDIDEDTEAKVLTIIQLFNEEFNKIVPKLKEIDSYFGNMMYDATDSFKRNSNMMYAKALGTEAGILCASDSLFMSSLGTYVTTSFLQSDGEKAISNFNSTIASIDDNYNNAVLICIENFVKQLIFYCLLIFFTPTFEENKIIELIKLLSKDIKKTEAKEIFIKYPFLYSTHIEVIKQLSLDDINSFVDIIKYYGLENNEIIMLENIFNVNMKTKIGNIDNLERKITSKTLEDNYLEILISLLSVNKKVYLNKKIYDVLNKYIVEQNNKMNLFNKNKIRNKINDKLMCFIDLLDEKDKISLTEMIK